MAQGPAIAAAIAASHAQITDKLGGLSDEELLAPSLLPDWSRLTVVCHIRYGAEAINRLVNATRAGEPALFYPGGRAKTRDATLSPAPDETPKIVVELFADACHRLDATLNGLAEGDWSRVLVEPGDQVDLGPQTIEQLAILRLTEVDVHAVDMDIGIDRWTDTFAEVGLALRIARLAHRLANSPVPASQPMGSWLIRPTTGQAWMVTSSDDGVATRPAEGHEAADGVIAASSRDLIALMLGRPFEGDVSYDNEFARSFAAAFPGP